MLLSVKRTVPATIGVLIVTSIVAAWVVHATPPTIAGAAIVLAVWAGIASLFSP